MDFAKIDLLYKDVSYYKKHDLLTLEEWQFALRRQFGESHFFKIENRGKHPVFTDFDVFNPETGLTYKVAIRSKDNSANFCECNDFKTNGLGTCKHIQAVFKYIHSVLNKGNLLELGYLPAYTSIYLDYRGERKIKIRIGAENEKEFNAFASKFFDNQNVLKNESFDIFDEIVTQAKQINPSFRCYPDALELVLEVRESKKRYKLIEEKYLSNPSSNAFDSLVKTQLFPFQKDGICFIAKKGRCIIADDMGLGKTVQAIAAAELLGREIGISSVLIICPTSLKYQWKTEIERFTGKTPILIEGNPTKRYEIYQTGSFYKILSYNTAVNDIKEINTSVPDLIIIDEAQRIKNFKAKISQNIKKLKSPYLFVLTGTPLQNKLEELYSIVQFVNPFVLGPFFQFIHDHRLTDENGKVTGYRDLNRIGESLANTMIRRQKKEVLHQLPERMDKILYVPLTDAQRAAHDDYQASVSQMISKWHRQGFLNEKDRQRLMICLNAMRMACNSTYLLDQKSRNDTKIAELLNILEEIFVEGSEKVVIFSQWERMTRIVAEELQAHQIKFEHLHGAVPSANRGKLFDNFNNDPHCKVFLSTDIGGTGLNLQAASYLINLDIPWNHAVLEQRIARVYRLGQKHNVSIINMVSADSIEQRILGVLSFKKGLAEGIFDQGENTIFLEENKFKVLMNTMEEVIETLPASSSIEKQEDDQDFVRTPHPRVELPLNEHPVQQEIFFGQALIEDDHTEKVPAASKSSVDEVVSAEVLIQMGIDFFEKLAQTLSNPATSQELMSRIVQKDESDGKTYLKLPIENEKAVKNFLIQFTTMFKSKGE